MLSGWEMSGVDRHYRLDMERTAAAALVHQACDTSSVIRLRLAVVAHDLRKAALQAGEGGAHLLEIAKKFEKHARAGDNP